MKSEQSLATAAEALFLCNLLLAPGLAFAVLAWLWWRRRATAGELARCHLEQTFFVSLWGGILIVVSVLFIALFGWDWEWTWVMVILYFTLVHTTLVMLGILGLARAMAGKPFRYPWIGPRTPACR